MRMRCTSLIVGVAAALLGTPAEGAFCVKKSGIVAFRTTCKRKETLLDPAQFVGPAGPPGAPGAAGAPGSALAFAYVNPDGSVDATISHNISSSNVTVGSSPGAYCFHDLSFTPSNITATLDAASFSPGTTNPIMSTAIPGGGGFCGVSTEAGVFIWTGSTNEAHGFFVVFN